MIQNAIRTVRSLLPSDGAVTMEQINEAIETVLQISMYLGIDRDELLRKVESIYNIRIEDYKIIEGTERRKHWLNEKKTLIWPQGETTFWTRYREYLETEKNFSPDVVNKQDTLTNRILDALFDPTGNVIIDKRGLVVGQVQSGKTSNYTGLLCKAADAGFKFIVVLAGIHKNLRSQTQLRIDEGFLGFDTQHQRAFNQNDQRIGVGRVDSSKIAHSLTSSLDSGDFTAAAANALGINFDTKDPIIVVVKKNAKVLNRLLQWLKAQSVETSEGRKIRNKSLLMIDDEADNASINTSKKGDGSTKINGLIRDILRLFDKSGYVGYTATPFANVFIPIEDDNLFPRDFIINLPAPSNYIGPEEVFGFEPVDEDNEKDGVLPIVQRIDDFAVLLESRLPNEAPSSLKLAIKCFILTCSIRRLRGQKNEHNSMLVHISRLTGHQRNVKELVEDTFNFYKRGIEMNIPGVIEELREAFESDSGNYKSYITISDQISNSSYQDSEIRIHSWKAVLPHLNEAASRIYVREINGGSADALNYFDHRKEGLNVIAIGGDKLSRGLTLEGLSVSYYLRTSKMYDTLMQMGRWFGYRPGYADLCRLFISRELNEWFCHITLASQQLRAEFDYMADVASSTPDQYGLRVRTYPGVLQISASNKIRSAVPVQVSWAGTLTESYELSKDPEIVESNLKSGKKLIKQIKDNLTPVKNSYLAKNVELYKIKDFLGQFRCYENLKSAASYNILKYIEENEKSGELNNWAVAIISKSIKDKTSSMEIEGIRIGLIRRKEEKDKSDSKRYYIRKSHIISPNDEFIDLSSDEYQSAISKTAEDWAKRDKEGVPGYPSGQLVRNSIRKPNRPLLLLYFLDPSDVTYSNNTLPYLGYAISFPGNDRNDAVSFAVHEQLLDRFNEQDDNDPEIEDDED